MSMVSCKKKRPRCLNHLQIHIILPLRWQSGKVDVGEGIVDWSLMIFWLRTIIQSAVNIASILQIYIVQSYAFMLIKKYILFKTYTLVYICYTKMSYLEKGDCNLNSAPRVLAYHPVLPQQMAFHKNHRFFPPKMYFK